MPPSPPRRILAIDDDEQFLLAAGELLRAAGHEFRGIREATRAVPEARAFDPHLMIIDRVMPVLNGSEVVRSLRAFAETAGIPVVFATEEALSLRDLLHGLAAGALDVLHKPFGQEQVQRLIAILDELSSRPPAPPPPNDEATLRALLGVFAREARTGVLTVNEGTPFEGRAVFRQGRLASADFGPLQFHEALREMLLTEDGLWSFYGDLDRPRAPSRPIAPAAPTPPPLPPPEELFRPKLMVVDDVPELRRLFKAQLSRAGFDVAMAEDGAVAVELCGKANFDLIIADLNMPRLDGWGMLKLLKADHRTREIPVVFLSSHDDYRETLKAARSGAADYLPKLGHADAVLRRVAALLAPRMDALTALRDGRELEIQTPQVGIQWLLRAISKLGLTGRVELQDEWARYALELHGGSPVRAEAVWPSKQASGIPAAAALLVARAAVGRFRLLGEGDVPSEDRLSLGMEALLQRACEALNQLEARVTASRLNAAGTFRVDPGLYELYRRIAPEKALKLARAVCEERLSPAELPIRLALKPEEVQDGLKELLRRGVIRFEEASN